MRQSQEARCWIVKGAHTAEEVKRKSIPFTGNKNEFDWGYLDIVLSKRKFPIKSFLENIYCNKWRLRISTRICYLGAMSYTQTLQKLSLFLWITFHICKITEPIPQLVDFTEYQVTSIRIPVALCSYMKVKRDKNPACLWFWAMSIVQWKQKKPCPVTIFEWN